jgi:O-antigen/teichoic acid export membrane protein
LIKAYLNKIAKDTGWVLGLNIINFSSSFVIAVFVSRMLGVEQLGTYTFITAFASVLYLISDFGLTTLIVRKIAENKKETAGLLNKTNIIKSTGGFLSLAIFFLLIYFLDNKHFNLSLAAGIIVILPRLYQTTYEASIRVFEFQKYPTIIRSVNSLLQIIFSYVVIQQGFGLEGIFVLILYLEIFTYIIFAITNRRILIKNGISLKPNLKDKRESLLNTVKESSVLFLNNVLSFTIPRVHIILLEYISSTVSVGIFSAGVRFTSGAGLVSGALYNSVYPFIANIKEQKKTSFELAKELVKYSIILGVVISVLLFLFSNLLIDLTFKIEEAKPILKIVSFSVLPLLVYTITQTYMLSIYKEKFLLKAYSLVWIFNLVLAIFLILNYGYIGAAAVTISIEYLLMIIQLVKFYSLGKKLNDSTVKS